MRMNIELDDVLINEAIRLSRAASKDEAIHFALMKLVESEKKKRSGHQNFLAKYTSCPEQVNDFTPLSRNEVNERTPDLC